MGLVITLFTVTAAMVAQVNVADRKVQKHNLRSVQAQANTSQPIPVALPITGRWLHQKER
ncbi:MAG: hypothetical protein HC789_19995 [Microcoleus sp. CSU_2_2]|nr:hypothetical protein [Microcoleus sp. SU_5_3]NJS12493.1 hypothetical protein [Microcoleus sp. CSU_2_2]